MKGRNDLCHCGSGLKYKKCCLNVSGLESSQELYFPPVLADVPLDFGSIKRIPSYSEYQSITFDEITYSKFEKAVTDSELTSYLSFDDGQKSRFLGIIKAVCKHKPRKFDLHILDENQFSELVCGEHTKKYASSIYWNEIDQYIHQYRVEVFSLMSERVGKIARYFEDTNTSAFIARQVMELSSNSISNQWVLTTCYNLLYKTIRDLDGSQIMTCKCLEDFVMSLVALPKKYVKNLQKELPSSACVKFDSSYRVPSYDPATYRQIEICKFVTKNIFDTGFKCDDDIVSSAESINKYYSHLCKFAHPTPMWFDVGFKNVNVDKNQKELYIKSEILKSLYHSLLLYLNLFESEVFYERAYTDLVIGKYSKHNLKITKVANFETDIIEKVVNKYKDIVVNTTEGDLVIVKKPGSD